MDVIIRPVAPGDAPGLCWMRRAPGVFENTLGIPSARLEDTQKFLAGLGPNDHVFVAEAEGQVVGIAGLHVPPNPRLNHSASVGINIDVPWQGKGVGTRLLEQLLEVADNWLMLVRVELTVFSDNARAIALYRKLGFEEEGVKRYAAKRSGKYEDEYIMARYRNLPTNHKE